MTERNVTRRYSIEGRVQGVGFRWFTRQTAGEIGLSGWVRNLPDGTVEAAARGSEEQLDRFEARLREGPPSSHVRRLDVDRSHDGSDITAGFEIRR